MEIGLVAWNEDTLDAAFGKIADIASTPAPAI